MTVSIFGRWHARAVHGVALMCCAGALPAAAQELQSRDDAWWTGPMLAPSAATLPQGHALIEPYLYDYLARGSFDADGHHHAGAAEHDPGSLTYWLYGLTDRITAGAITRFGYNSPSGAPGALGVGDLTLQIGYGLTQFTDGQRVPAIALVFDETVPTGRYDQLARASQGFGTGAYTSAVSLYSQDYLWLPNGRILRVRLDLTYGLSSRVTLRDASVYGTPFGFRGHADPGAGFTADAAAEYSLTRRWVLALDLVYQHNDATRVAGSLPGDIAFGSGAPESYAVALAPAIEYNFSARVGLLCGVRLYPAGRSAAASVTPALALNMVF